MKRTGWIVFGWALVLMPLVFLALCGCEVGSADSVVRMVAADFSGFYQGVGSNGTQMVVPPNSGDEVTLLNLRQNGDQLEAIDNNGIVFRGTLGNLVDTTASFTLEGRTTVGRSVTISGTLTGEGSAGTMRGTWIEPNLYSTISGKAVINPAPTNAPSDDVKLLASSTSIAVSESVTLTASGASVYNWSATGSASGTFEAGNGTDGNNRWRATGTGTVTITATDADDITRSDSVGVTVTEN